MKLFILAVLTSFSVFNYCAQAANKRPDIELSFKVNPTHIAGAPIFVTETITNHSNSSRIVHVGFNAAEYLYFNIEGKIARGNQFIPRGGLLDSPLEIQLKPKKSWSRPICLNEWLVLPAGRYKIRGRLVSVSNRGAFFEWNVVQGNSGMREKAMKKLEADAMLRSFKDEYLMQKGIAATAHQEIWVRNYISKRVSTSPFWRDCFTFLQAGWSAID